jgi:hypothetical protein
LFAGIDHKSVGTGVCIWSSTRAQYARFWIM